MMKHAGWLVVWGTVVAAFLLYPADSLTTETEVAAAPPLSLEGYLDEKLPESSDTAKLKVDNTACYVCHGYYDEEEMVIVHGKAEVSCIDCHGKSYEHRNDEDNITPPDKMYAPDGVDKMCSTCHEEHDAPAVKVLARWQERCAEKTDPKKVICTDCHGDHRMKRRTVRWDKKTGELILDQEEQPEEQASQPSAG
jgi:hypothetical protein